MTKQRNRGFTLFEIIAVIALGSLLLVGLSSMIDTTLDDNKAQQAGFYQAQVVNATMKYMEGKPDFLALKTATGPYAVSLATLQSEGYLPPSFAGANAYGQTPCVLVKRRNAGFGDKLDALIVTAGGTTILDKDLPSAAANAGPGGGYIKADTPTTAIAQGPTWVLSTVELGKFVAPGGCLAGNLSDAGHLASALFYDAGQLATDFLYRNKVSGRPELNKMNTPVYLTGTAVAQTPQTGVCDVTVPETWGSLTTDKDGAVLSCEEGVWERQEGRYWKNPAVKPSAVGYKSPFDSTSNRKGDVRIDTVSMEAFKWDGFKWIPLALDENGRLTATDMVIERQVKAGAACSAADPTGTVATEESTGLILSCQSNVWTTQSSLRNRKDLAKSATWVILASSQPVSDLPSSYYTHPGGFDYDASTGWSSAIFSTDPIQPGKEGLLVVQTHSTMDHQQNSPKPLEIPSPTAGGQFEVKTWVEDRDTGKAVGTPTTSKSGKLRNEAVTINAALVQALPKNNAGYVVKFIVRWTTFEGTKAGNIYDKTWWSNSSGKYVYQTPLMVTYSVDVST